MVEHVTITQLARLLPRCLACLVFYDDPKSEEGRKRRRRMERAAACVPGAPCLGLNWQDVSGTVDTTQLSCDSIFIMLKGQRVWMDPNPNNDIIVTALRQVRDIQQSQGCTNSNNSNNNHSNSSQRRHSSSGRSSRSSPPPSPEEEPIRCRPLKPSCQPRQEVLALASSAPVSRSNAPPRPGSGPPRPPINNHSGMNNNSLNRQHMSKTPGPPTARPRPQRSNTQPNGNMGGPPRPRLNTHSRSNSVEGSTSGSMGPREHRGNQQRNQPLGG